MSPENTSQKLNNPGITDEEKRRKHAEAQRKYRERNLEATREKARERMSRLRESAKPLKARLQRKQRRGRDAENREVLRKRKFVAEFGQDAFHDYYLPHLRLLAVDELPGISRQYRKDVANTPEAHKEKGGDTKKKKAKKEPLFLQLQKFEAARDESVASVPIRPNQSAALPFFKCPSPLSSMICRLPFYPNHGNYKSDDEHDLNARKFWFLVLRAGLFTKRLHLSHARGGGCSLGGALSRLPHPRRPKRRRLGRGGRPLFLPSTVSDPRAFHTAFDDTSTLHPGKTVRASIKREVRASIKREVCASVKREAPSLVKEVAKAPLFRDDGEVSPLSRPRKRPTPPSPPSSRKRSPSATAHSVSPRTPGPDASPSHASPPSTGTSAGSISSVSSLSASVGSSASRAAPPLRSLPWYPPSSRPAAAYSHAGSSARVGAGTQARHHAKPPVLFNKTTRVLYKDPLETDVSPLGTCSATAVREMGKEDSVQVLEVEDLEEFFSAPSRAAA
ncbi:hypothetical protein B0H14DRAFT_2643135 [Mycena olivaceomarginata]|nr:hypothetical protein B0H14DRAFT_2643135 [Mycena olivaceomarginata]